MTINTNIKRINTNWKVGDQVEFSYLLDKWHKATITGFCFSGKVQVVDENGKTHVFWPEALRR